MNERVGLSIVIPVLNEEECVFPLYERLAKVLDGLELSSEIIYVDDGSDDNTAARLRELYKRDERLRVIILRRNFGQTAALSAGFKNARGDIVISMDGDEQNCPEDIPALLSKIDEGYDVVSGWRKNRCDTSSRRIPSKFANKMIGLLTGIKLHDFGCTLKAYRREALEDIQLYGEMHRMIPVLAHWMGARIAEIEVDHQPRVRGVSKYGVSFSLGRTLNVILDLITLKFFMGYFTRPLHFFGLLGLALLLFGFASGALVVLMKLIGGVDMTGNAFIILSVLLLIVGVQLIVLGLLGEVNIRTYFESQKKQIYSIRETLDH